MPSTATNPFMRSTFSLSAAAETRRARSSGSVTPGSSMMKESKSSCSWSSIAVVMRPAVFDVVLDGQAKAQQHGRIDAALRGRHDLHRARQMRVDQAGRPAARFRVHKIALRQDHEVGAGNLILEDFLDRIVMVERIVGGALRGKRIHVGSDLAGGERGAVHHRDHAVHRDAALHRRPLERLHQRLRQGEAGGLDDDVIDLRLHRQNLSRAPGRNRRRRCSTGSHWRVR